MMLSVVSKAFSRNTFPPASSLRVGCRRNLAVIAQVPKDRVPSQDGDRLVIHDDGMTGKSLKGPILIAKVSDQYHAIHGICPHMQKSMERGKIILPNGDGSSSDPVLRCPVHNTRFNMRTGKCVKWVTGVLGYDNALVGRVAQNIGGVKQDIPAYTVHVNVDGSLSIDDEIKE